MISYETVFAVPVTLSEEEREQSIKGIEKLIQESGGEVKASEDLGERKLAYKVKNHTRAYYHLIKFVSPTDKIDILKKYYRITGDYIRYMIVKDE